MNIFRPIWTSTLLNYHEKLQSLATTCSPCAHCGGNPQVGHNDYLGDHYTGDMFEISCSKCGIGTESDKWEIVEFKWNRRIHESN